MMLLNLLNDKGEDTKATAITSKTTTASLGPTEMNTDTKH